MDTKLLDVNDRTTRLSARLWTPFLLSSLSHKAGAGLGICSTAEECLPGTYKALLPSPEIPDTSKAICSQQYFFPGPGGEPFGFKERLEDKNLSIIYLVHLVARYCCMLHVTRKLCNQHHPFLLFSCKDTQTQHSLKSCSQK